MPAMSVASFHVGSGAAGHSCVLHNRWRSLFRGARAELHEVTAASRGQYGSLRSQSCRRCGFRKEPSCSHSPAGTARSKPVSAVLPDELQRVLMGSSCSQGMQDTTCRPR